MARIEIPLSEVLPSPAGGIDTGVRPPQPPENIGHLHKFTWAQEIKAVAIIPDFEVPTADARNVLPKSYSRADVVSDFVILDILPFKLSRGYSNNQSTGLQSAACRITPYRIRNVSSRSWDDFPCHAGQSPSAVSADIDTRVNSNLTEHDTQDSARPTRNLSIRGRPHDPSAGYRELQGDCWSNYRTIQ